MSLKSILTKALLINLYTLLVVFITFNVKVRPSIGEDTKKLCMEYAQRDHEKEIAPERYKWLTKEFVDNYDWYQSCLNHIRYPVAKENQ